MTDAPAFLQLAGHKLRWRLLRELARSDRAVAELTGATGEPQNLVSYHLGKLRAAELVSSRRSSADGRDTYYALNLTRVGDLLSAAGGALHPGLALVAPPREAAAIKPVKVLFVCTGNSARSQMAEALAKARSNGAIEAHSAGTHPSALHPNAVRALRETHGLNISKQKSKHIDGFIAAHFDLVISLCDRAREACPDFAGAPEMIHWSIPNPVTSDSDDVTYPVFQQLAADLAVRIDFLIAALAEQTQGRIA